MSQDSQRIPWLETLLDYFWIAVGSLIVALAADLFAIPNRVIPGGVTGIATILHYTLGTPVGLVTLALNIPLFIAGIRWGGGMRFATRTIFAVVVLSLAIDFLAPRLPVITTDPLLYTLYGGILDGLGIGIVFRARGTTGGTDILARLLNRWTGWPLGTILLAANVVILGTAGLTFGWEQALYAMILSYASGRTVDLVQEGFNIARSVLIISEHPEKLRVAILQQLGRGVTILHGRGGYTQAERPVLLCVVTRPEVSRLKRLIHAIDPNAFVVIGQAQEVLGEGFRRIEPPE